MYWSLHRLVLLHLNVSQQEYEEDSQTASLSLLLCVCKFARCTCNSFDPFADIPTSKQVLFALQHCTYKYSLTQNSGKPTQRS
jgi:hypothetical protein